MLRDYKKISLCIVFFLTIFLLLSCIPVTESFSSARKLTILGTGDLQGQLDANLQSIHIIESGPEVEVMGGISRIATLIKRIQQESANPVIVISSGDDLMGKYFHEFSGKAIFHLMEISGYEVMALGNHEFDRGPGVLAQALDAVSLSALCSDLVVQNTVLESGCQKYILRDYYGIRVGFFSLMTEDFPVITVAGEVTIRNSPDSVARDMVELLKKNGAEVIVAVTHIGMDRDRKLAAGVQGIDIIFGGHSHNYASKLERVGNTLIVNGGEKGIALVRLDVELDAMNRIVADSATYSLLSVGEKIQPDPVVKLQLSEYRSQLPAATVLGITEKEWDLTNTVLRNRESAVADMITDMIRSRFQVDIVLFNGGAFRGNAKISPGEVTDTMLAEIDEFESDVFLMTIQGKYLRQILEHSATLIGHGGFLQGSGIKFTIETGARPQKIVDRSNGESSIIRKGQRIRDLQIMVADGSWQPLEEDRYYNLASNDFLVERNGDNYFWFKKYGKNIRNTYTTMGAVMTDAFHREKVVSPAGTDGRMMIK
jgi:5'-nucleotidase